MDETGKPRHPLPNSAEARHDEIPESAEREKGVGEDAKQPVEPEPDRVDPDGQSYRDDESGG